MAASTCTHCGAPAVFKTEEGEPFCEFCPVKTYADSVGRAAAAHEITIAALIAILGNGVTREELHGLVDAAADRGFHDVPCVPASVDKHFGDRMSEGPWLKGLTPITGRGEAIIATRTVAGDDEAVPA